MVLNGRMLLVSTDCQIIVSCISESEVGIKAKTSVISRLVQEAVKVEVIENVTSIQISKVHPAIELIVRQSTERSVVHVVARLLHWWRARLARLVRLLALRLTIWHLQILVLLEVGAVRVVGRDRWWRCWSGRLVSTFILRSSSWTLFVCGTL